MFKKFRVVSVLVLAAFALTVSVGGLIAADDKVPSVSEIMKKGHSKMGDIAKLRTAVKGMKWEAASAPATELKAFGEALGKNKPEKGTEESWKKFADAYKTSTSAAAEAVEKKDAAAVTAALGKINCMGCHKAHK